MSMNLTLFISRLFYILILNMCTQIPVISCHILRAKEYSACDCILQLCIMFYPAAIAVEHSTELYGKLVKIGGKPNFE